MVYDITNRESFEHVHDWIKMIEEIASDNVNKILIGNKIDLFDKREVLEDEGKEIALKYNMKFLEASAQENINMEKLREILT